MPQIEEPKREEKVKVILNIPKESDLDVDVDSLKIGKGTKVALEGKITSLNKDELGQSFGMEVTSVSFGSGTMKEDAEEVQEIKKIRG